MLSTWDVAGLCGGYLARVAKLVDGKDGQHSKQSVGSVRDPQGIPEGSSSKRRDPAQMHLVFCRGSSVRSVGFYNIKKGRRVVGRVVVERF